LLKFNQADSSVVFDIYQEISGRTLLASPALVRTKITLKTQTELSRAEAVWMLEEMFFLSGIQLIQEGTKFTFALPAIRNAAAPKIPAHPLAEKLKASTKTFPVGTFKLSQASAQQVLPLYAELIERQPLFDPSSRTPATQFTLRTQTNLTLVEAVYAFDALAALNHFQFALVGDKQVKVVHTSDAGNPAGTN
jgi:type II secretory pathway component GspD/PulD (secretin)